MNYHGLLLLAGVLLAAVWLGGCQSHEYRSPDGAILRVTRLMTDAEVGTLEAGRTEDGPYLRVQALKSESERVVEAAVRSALEASR